MRSALLVILFICGCSEQDGITETIDYGLTDIEIGKEKFESEFGTQLNSTISFSDEPYKGTIARCYQYGNKIEIVIAIWKDLAPETRQAVIIHEGSHCILGLSHFGTNIMNEALWNIVDAYVNRYEESINEIKIKFNATIIK